MSAFAWGGGWPLLLLAPVAWYVQVLLVRQRIARARRVFGPRVAALADERPPRRSRTRRALSTLAVFCAGLALMGPLGPEVVPEVPGRGVDVLVCLDVSRSMLARDVQPDRLAAAREQLAALAQHAAGDRLGLVTFAGDARLAVPLTRDLASWSALLEAADPLATSLGGSDLGAALTRALAALPEAAARHAAVLLISDGEDTGRGAETALAGFAARGVPLHVVSLGSARGSRIPLPADDGAPERFLRDREGREVVSRSDPAGLARLADLGGGAFLELGAEPAGLLALYDAEVRARARDVLADASLATRQPRFQWPLLVGVLLGMLSLCLSERKPVA